VHQPSLNIEAGRFEVSASSRIPDLHGSSGGADCGNALGCQLHSPDRKVICRSAHERRSAGLLADEVARIETGYGLRDNQDCEMSMTFQMRHGTVNIPTGKSELECPCGCGERWEFTLAQSETRTDFSYKIVKPEYATWAE
jgi:hypothetical protein